MSTETKLKVYNTCVLFLYDLAHLAETKEKAEASSSYNEYPV